MRGVLHTPHAISSTFPGFFLPIFHTVVRAALVVRGINDDFQLSVSIHVQHTGDVIDVRRVELHDLRVDLAFDDGGCPLCRASGFSKWSCSGSNLIASPSTRVA